MTGKVPPESDIAFAEVKESASGTRITLPETPEALCRPPFRQALGRALSGFLEKHILSVTELLHNEDALSALDQADRTEQAAMERIAIRHAPRDQTALWIKRLEELLAQRRKQVQADSRNGVFLEFEAAHCRTLAAELAASARGPYILRGAIARHLRNISGANAKLIALSTMVESGREDLPGWQMLHEAADDILTDLLRLPAFMTDLLTERQDFGNLLLGYVKLFLGNPVECRYGRGQGLDRLAWHYAAGDLPQSHTALGARICRDIARRKPLSDGPPRKELLYFRQLSELVHRCVGPHLSLKEIESPLQTRSARLGEADNIRDALSRVRGPDEKIRQLFFIDSCLCDKRSRYKLAEILFRTITADSFHHCYQSTQKPLTERLHELAGFARKARKSRFDEDQKQKLIELFDIEAWTLARKARLFDSIDARYDNAAEKALLIARQFREGNITEKRLGRLARKRMMYYLASDGFYQAFLSFKAQQNGEVPAKDAADAEIREMLKYAGIIPDIVLYRIG